MDQFKQYQFTINVKTNTDPREAIFKIVDTLKGIIPVLSIEHHLIEERPTDVEHHGGVVENDNS
tara:strand:+ start:276 stop:467 length:192 start_codon:yes stop_codon:yes gene_type:complete